MENRTLRPTIENTPWDRTLAILKPKVGAGAYDTWFRPTRFLEQAGSTLRVRVPNEMFAEWLRSQYLTDIRSALGEVGLSSIASVEFLPPKDSVSDRESLPPAPRQRLNARYTFDNFVVSSCNKFAHAAAVSVSEKPGRSYNPLFLYGGVGLGKTHLMQAIGTQLLQSRPGTVLRYQTSEQFMNELITSIRFEDTQSFRDRYRSVDVLLIDDIQFMAGKESTQEEFFHTFNELYDGERQIVLTSDCPPRSIPALEERLRSRFEWGLIADLHPPDLETKIAILNKMAAANGWPLPQEVSLFVAGNVHSNIRELEGSLTTLVAASTIQRRPLDLRLARDVVKTLAPADREPATLDAVFRVVARHFSLKTSDLKIRTNARRITFPRQIAMYLAKKLARESLPTIGKVLGGKHHTTVLHGVRKIERLYASDPAIQTLVNRIEQELT